MQNQAGRCTRCWFWRSPSSPRAATDCAPLGPVWTDRHQAEPDFTARAEDAARFLAEQAAQLGLDANAVPLAAWRMREMFVTTGGHLRAVGKHEEARRVGRLSMALAAAPSGATLPAPSHTSCFASAAPGREERDSGGGPIECAAIAGAVARSGGESPVRPTQPPRTRVDSSSTDGGGWHATKVRRRNDDSAPSRVAQTLRPRPPFSPETPPPPDSSPSRSAKVLLLET